MNHLCFAERTCAHFVSDPLNQWKFGGLIPAAAGPRIVLFKLLVLAGLSRRDPCKDYCSVLTGADGPLVLLQIIKVRTNWNNSLSE